MKPLLSIIVTLNSGFTFITDFVYAGDSVLERKNQWRAKYSKNALPENIDAAYVPNNIDDKWFIRYDWESVQLFNKNFLDLNLDEKMSVVEMVLEGCEIYW